MDEFTVLEEIPEGIKTTMYDLSLEIPSQWTESDLVEFAKRRMVELGFRAGMIQVKETPERDLRCVFIRVVDHYKL